MTNINWRRADLLKAALADLPSAGHIRRPADWADVDLLKDDEQAHRFQVPHGTPAEAVRRVKITFNRDEKFDIQLASSIMAEGKLADLLTQKIEMKTETWQWRRTGNIAIEYRSHGRPSGIAVTQAILWIHELRDDDGDTLVYLMFEVARLKQLCRQAYRQGRWRRGGDDNEFEMVLLPVDLNRYLGPPS